MYSAVHLELSQRIKADWIEEFEVFDEITKMIE
jgi:hypothetical protein